MGFSGADGDEEAEVEGIGVGAADLVITPLFQTNLVPFLIHV
jgi:hypothetical protein